MPLFFKKKLLSFFCTAVLCCVVAFSNVYAQATQENPTKDTKPTPEQPVQPPTVVPLTNGDAPSTISYNTGQTLSPTTQNLVNSINASVNLYTGTANVAIPLCSLPAESISIPVGLNYTAGNGVKIDDDPDGLVGQGWNLQAGGMITRMVRGVPDEEPDGYTGQRNRGSKVTSFLTGTMQNLSSREELFNEINKGAWDAEADVFYFVLPTGLSGKFVLKPDGTPMTIPYLPITIKPAIGRAAQQNYWEIITQDGLVYTFGQGEQFVETTKETIEIPNETPKTTTYKSTWNINAIRNTDNVTLATFTYKNIPLVNLIFPSPNPTYYGKISKRFVQHQFYETARSQGNCDNCPPLAGLKTISITTQILSLSILEKIQTLNGVLFFDSGAFICFNIPTIPDINDPCSEVRIRKITLTNPLGTEIKSWQFSYAYYPDGIRTKLSTVKASDAPPTRLFYNETMTMPAPNAFTAQQDWWGYYNNNAHSTLLPPYGNQAGANREPSESRTQAYILTKIVNPLGAVTEFEYENHRYSTDNGIEKLVGGLRVKSIINKTNDTPQATSNRKNYIYKTESMLTSSGVVLQPHSYLSQETNRHNPCQTNTWIPLRCSQIFTKVVSAPLNSWFSADYIAYHTVTEQIPQSGKTVTKFYSATDNPDQNDTFYMPIVGATSSNYLAISSLSVDGSSTLYARAKHSFQHRRGLPKSTVVYDERGEIRVAKLDWYRFEPKDRANYLKAGYIDGYGYESFLAHYSDISEAVMLDRTEEYVYDQPRQYYGLANPNDRLKSEVSYTYNASSLPVEVRKKLPTGETLITRTKYIKDVLLGNTCEQQRTTCNQACPTPIEVTCVQACDDDYVNCLSNYQAGIVNDEMSAALTTLVQKGMQAPVETTTWLQKIGEPEKLLSASLTRYKKFGIAAGIKVRAYQTFQLRIKADNLPDINSFTPAKVNEYTGTFEADARYELISTHQYNPNDGLLIETQAQHGQPSAMVYDDKKTVIANVSNAKATQVYHTSFEEFFWSFTGGGAVSGLGEARTGAKYYNLEVQAYNLGNMVQGNITDGSINYVLTYWHKANSSANWQLVEENLTYTQLINKVITETGWIDEVRVHPVDALMTTVTYEPLVGKTSETDANHRTIYYEYDSQHRLKYTKDEKRNILEAYQYNVVGN